MVCKYIKWIGLTKEGIGCKDTGFNNAFWGSDWALNQVSLYQFRGSPLIGVLTVGALDTDDRVRGLLPREFTILS